MVVSCVAGSHKEALLNLHELIYCILLKFTGSFPVQKVCSHESQQSGTCSEKERVSEKSVREVSC